MSKDVMWFSLRSGMTIGIATKVDKITGFKKAYISTVSGFDEELDREYILSHGSPVPIQYLIEMLK